MLAFAVLAAGRAQSAQEQAHGRLVDPSYAATAGSSPGGFAQPSRCGSIPGFEAVDRFPTRSPLVVADHLISLVEGKAFAEIGTRNGDIMSCVKYFAASVSAIELDRHYCKVLEKRGVEVCMYIYIYSDPG